MYDSEGITPEALEKAGLHVDLPADFYSKITEKHMAERHPEGQEESFDVTGLPPTTLIFYLNRDQFEFRATVLRIINERYVILDNTAFFARSGGQEPDHGTINGLYVSDVMKFNNVVLHKIEGIESERIRVGEEVSGLVDAKRRSLIMRHHTATHIINGACRKLIGPWVWQHSAFKDEDVGRLDITHFAHLTREQVLEIERTANDVVRSNLPVIIKWIPRNQAEATYGFRLYQGGVVPVKELRIVNIQGWDVEACGGTHCSTTGEVGMIKITKAERVQDGVERLEFVAGEAAVNYIQRQESILMQSAGMLQTPADKLASSVANTLNSLEEARRSSKNLAKRLADFMIVSVPKEAQAIEKVKLYVSPPSHEGLDLEYHVAVGDKLSRSQPELVYVGFFNENDRTRVVAFCGSVARNEGVRANLLIRP